MSDAKCVPSREVVIVVLLIGKMVV